MIEEAAGTRMYEYKKIAAQKTIEKKEAKLKEIKTVINLSDLYKTFLEERVILHLKFLCCKEGNPPSHSSIFHSLPCCFLNFSVVVYILKNLIFLCFPDT